MAFNKYILDLFYKKRTLSTTKVILYTSLYFVFFHNSSFFQHVLQVYPISVKNSGFLLSLAVVFTSLLIVLFSLLSSKYTIKPLLLFFLLLSSITAYFMDNYNVVIDYIMIQNTLETNLAETLDLLSPKLLYYVLLLGILPSFFVYTVNIESVNWKKSALNKIKAMLISLLVIVGIVLTFSKFYTSFAREHEFLRHYTNPTYYLYSVSKYLRKNVNRTPIVVAPLGIGARITETDDDKNDDLTELVILVVGEAARADHFSLNGYQKETNPLLKKENIINFSNLCSCGTSTAYSIPCMFSVYDRADYDYKKGASTENILDVLTHTKEIEILWRDNNSSSKGVASRVPYENFRTSKNNSICTDGECRDEGMLIGLDSYIEQRKGKDILIILHQMGNHGPAYYKRYPKEFEKFTPVCQTNQLEDCSQEEISNAYDNALLYTDYFLSKVINLLKKYDESHETALIYMSDHGESLGENGVYLHGLPYFIAPDAQTHVAALIWLGKAISKEKNITKIKQNQDNVYTHDNLFHTLLGIFEVETTIYDEKMDILHN